MFKQNQGRCQEKNAIISLCSVEILKSLGDNIRQITTNSSYIMQIRACDPIETMEQGDYGKSGN